ncbi:MAG: metal-dependent hydrolase [Vulcanimicrobiota bacterium]
MSPITHFLASWVIADTVLEDDRDKMLVACAGILPDLDSLGVVCDFASPALGGPETTLYADYHHFLFHGLAGITVLSALLAWKAVKKGKVFWWSMLVAHLHCLCDFVGSRGRTDTIDDLWPIYYFGPFSREVGNLLWEGQWKLNGWQNVSFTVGLLVWVFYAAWKYDRSPLRPISKKAHRGFVDTLRARFGQPGQAPGGGV